MWTHFGDLFCSDGYLWAKTEMKQLYNCRISKLCKGLCFGIINKEPLEVVDKSPLNDVVEDCH